MVRASTPQLGGLPCRGSPASGLVALDSPAVALRRRLFGFGWGAVADGQRCFTTRTSRMAGPSSAAVPPEASVAPTIANARAPPAIAIKTSRAAAKDPYSPTIDARKGRLGDRMLRPVLCRSMLREVGASSRSQHGHRLRSR